MSPAINEHERTCPDCRRVIAEEGAPRLRWPTPEQLRAMLEPTWDVTKSWDGRPAMTESPRVIASSSTGRPIIEHLPPGGDRQGDQEPDV